MAILIRVPWLTCCDSLHDLSFLPRDEGTLFGGDEQDFEGLNDTVIVDSSPVHPIVMRLRRKKLATAGWPASLNLH